jgi:hypothetical protein
MDMLRKVAPPMAVLLGLLGSPAIVLATPINGSPTGLASPTYTISFNEGTTVDGQTITNEFSAYGASFLNFGIDQSNLYSIEPGTTGFTGNYLLAGFAPWPTATPYVINFTTTVTDAAFATVDQGTAYTFASYLGASLVETFNQNIAVIPGSGFMGFSGSLFDSIKITPQTLGQPFAIDSLQFKTPAAVVPVPATLALFGLSLIGLGWSRRRIN